MSLEWEILGDISLDIKRIIHSTCETDLARNRNNSEATGQSSLQVIKNMFHIPIASFEKNILHLYRYE